VRAIWKYKLEVADTPISFGIPKDAKTCFVGLSPGTGNVSVWLDVPVGWVLKKGLCGDSDLNCED
jgi:hypothetical protein